MNISDMRREKARLFSPALLSIDVTDPEFATIIARFAFGEVTQFGELETRERVIIALSAVIATNGREAFRMVLRGALKAGMKEEDMKVIGKCIADIIKNGEDAIPRVTEKVLALCDAHPLYEKDVLF